MTILEHIEAMLLALFPYILLSLVAFFFGLMGANREQFEYIKPRCLKERSRIEILFPAYKLGCYLGGMKGKPYYYEEK